MIYMYALWTSQEAVDKFKIKEDIYNCDEMGLGRCLNLRDKIITTRGDKCPFMSQVWYYGI
jgi:hypothetical protein